MGPKPTPTRACPPKQTFPTDAVGLRSVSVKRIKASKELLHLRSCYAITSKNYETD